MRQEVLQPRSPAVRPHVMKGRYNAIGGNGMLIRPHAIEHIEPDRPLHVGWVEIDDFVGASAWHGAERALRQ